MEWILYVVFCKIHILVEEKDDSEAFIFTLRNPHHVAPTRFMKRVDQECAIKCDFSRGPLFGYHFYDCDLFIPDNCNETNSCYIWNDGKKVYECNEQYKSSLFVGTAGPNEMNSFSVLDYEVFSFGRWLRKNMKSTSTKTSQVISKCQRHIDKSEKCTTDVNSNYDKHTQYGLSILFL